MKLINGRKLASEIREHVKETITRQHLSPGLGVILVGDDPASHIYVGLKEKACNEVGIRFEKVLLPEGTSEEDVISRIQDLNNRKDIDAILVQLPLPEGINEDSVISAIDPRKDVDGFHPENISKLEAEEPYIIPVLLKVILTLIRSTGERVKGKYVVVLANSKIFAKPIQTVLLSHGANVTVHIAPNDPAGLINIADIIIVALGKPGFFTAEHIPDKAIIIDIGTNRLPTGGVVGDVNTNGLASKPGWITPVPGGVGPITVAILTENVLELHLKKV